MRGKRNWKEWNRERELKGEEELGGEKSERGGGERMSATKRERERE